MAKRTDINSILIIGAGPIVIGQACEFDYSGAQACKALREEGYRVILVNSNPATIMTDPELADAASDWRSAYVHLPFCHRVCPYCDFAVVEGRTDMIVASLWTTTSAPTGTFERAYGEAHGAFGEVLTALEAVDARIGRLEDDLEAAGAPYTPGRMPVWDGDERQ